MEATMGGQAVRVRKYKKKKKHIHTHIQNFGGEIVLKRLLGRPRRR